MQTAYFSGGCFWCVEAIFQRVDGVKELTNGYCNGSTQNPTYIKKRKDGKKGGRPPNS